MFAFAHLIGAWILGKAYQKIFQKKLGDYFWFFLLFGALLPDMDFLLDWTLGTNFHRTFTHSLIFLLFVPLLMWSVLFFFRKNIQHSSIFQERNTLPLAMVLGILSHFILDMILPNGIPLFWPSLLNFSFSTITFFDPVTPSFLDSSYQSLRGSLKRTVFEMALGTGWIFYLWWRRKIHF